MSNNNRPHSRNQRTGSGSAGVNTGRRVNTGGRVGSGFGVPGSSGGPGLSGGSGWNSGSSGSGWSSGSSGNNYGNYGNNYGSSSSGGFLAGLLGGLLGARLASRNGSGNNSRSGCGGCLGRILLIILLLIVAGFLLRACSSVSNGTGTGDTLQSALESAWSGKNDSVATNGVGSSSGSTSGSISGSSGSSSSNGLGYGSSGSYNYGDYIGSASFNDSQVDYAVSDLARDKFTEILGNGKDTVTVMVYMCGTDLESKYGMGTADLTEMVNATVGGNVNVIVLTGGCRGWKTQGLNNNEIYRIYDGALERLETGFSSKSMTDPSTLTAFINYCTTYYAANRNVLIMWDHGGGSVTGYGYDETQKSSNSMDLAEFDSALKKAGATFDWIGFDACLMGSLENATVCAKYADYLIASEELEPGTGWYYTNWLTLLSEDTSIATVDLAKKIIDDYITTAKRSSSSTKATLSIVDLAELQGTVPQDWNSFAAGLNRMLDNRQYTDIATARAGAAQFAKSSKINQVDLVDLAQRVGTDEALELAETLLSCVKYNRSSMTGANGLSIYFPYESTQNVSSAIAAYEALGLDAEYKECIRSFASVEYAGQIAVTGSNSYAGSYAGDIFGSSYSSGSSPDLSELLGQLVGSYTGSSSAGSLLSTLYGSDSYGSGSYGYGSSSSSQSYGSGSIFGSSGSGYDLTSLLSEFASIDMPSGYEWVDTDRISRDASAIAGSVLSEECFVPVSMGGHTVISLTDEEWALIQTVELNMFARDGDRYVDLGMDNLFCIDGNELYLEPDYTWLTIDGHVCAYYMVSDTLNPDGTWTTVGRIPCLLNGEPVNLQVIFDDASPYGTITGAFPLYTDNETDTQAKGNIPLYVGDTIELLCDVYNADGDFVSNYTLGAAFTLSDDPYLENLSLEADGLIATYCLTDIYGNRYWVPVE
ncbi:MAG: hypothetical protein HUJ69_07740 [Lachnospiraceae bacterium]|nr:hypothetical protein [Lachnospiraceae bacterium]